jgi:hypothetical protein
LLLLILPTHGPNRRFKFHKRGQHFIGVHNVTLSVVKARSVSTNRNYCRPGHLPIIISLHL